MITTRQLLDEVEGNNEKNQYRIFGFKKSINTVV